MLVFLKLTHDPHLEASFLEQTKISSNWGWNMFKIEDTFSALN